MPCGTDSESSVEPEKSVACDPRENFIKDILVRLQFACIPLSLSARSVELFELCQ